MPEIVFTLKKQSGKPCKVEAEVNGVQGDVCVTQLGPYMSALGNTEAAHDKPERHEHVGLQQSN